MRKPTARNFNTEENYFIVYKKTKKIYKSFRNVATRDAEYSKFDKLDKYLFEKSNKDEKRN
jgi:hypothetical protein